MSDNMWSFVFFSRESSKLNVNKKSEPSKDDLINIALRETYWNKSKELYGDSFMDSSNLSNIFYYLKEVVPDAQEDDVKFFLFMIPNNIFFDGLNWGFGDTGVRENLYEYITEEADLIKEMIQKSRG